MLLNGEVGKFFTKYERILEGQESSYDIENTPLYVEFALSGDISLHTQQQVGQFIFNVGRGFLGYPWSVDNFINEYVSAGGNVEVIQQNIVNDINNVVFDFEGEILAPYGLKKQFNNKAAVDEHGEEPVDLTDQVIFDANMSTMTRDHKISELKQKIDEALDSGDQVKFQELSQQYNDLLNLRAMSGRRLLRKAWQN